MNVRPARPDDARRVGEILVDTWRATYVGVMPQEVLESLSVERRASDAELWIAHPETHVFVAEHEGAVVGVVNVGPSWTSPGARPI